MLGRCHGTTPACKLAGSPGQCGFGRRKVCIQQTHPAMTISILIGIGLADPTSAAQLPKQTVLFVGDLQADAALIKAMVASTLKIKGVMAKRRCAQYQPGVALHAQRRAVVVVGSTPATAPTASALACRRACPSKGKTLC